MPALLPPRGRQLVGLGLLMLSQAACVPVVRHAMQARIAERDPSGARTSDVLLRRLLIAGAAEVAADALATTGPARALPVPWTDARLEPTGDALLDALLTSATAFYAGRYATSTALVEEAERLAEQRVTRSVTREATAWLTNDAGRDYRPSRAELAMLPYYGVLAYLSRSDIAGATVEARRLAQRLEETDAGAAPHERSLRAALRALTASVFEAAGEWNDAAVARRHVVALTGDSSVAPRVGDAPAAPDSSDVLVVVEQGFVPHRIPQVAVLSGVSGPTSADGIATRLAEMQARDPFGGIYGLGRWRRGGWRLDDVDGSATGERSRTALTLAWPVLARAAEAAPSILQLRTDAGTQPLLIGDVAESIAGEYRQALPGLIARVATRALAQRAALAAIDARKGKGRAAAVLLGLTMAAFEAADTRSWSMLPARVAIRTVRVPSADKALRLELGGVARTVPLVGSAPALRLAHVRLFDGLIDPPAPLLVAQRAGAP